MRSDEGALLSGTVCRPDEIHHIELIHQRQPGVRLTSIDLWLYGADGTRVVTPLDPGLEIYQLPAVATDTMVAFDVRYRIKDFRSYRPHHYGYRRTANAETPPLYYALNAVRGAIPARVGRIGPQNIESAMLPDGLRYRVFLGNLSLRTAITGRLNDEGIEIPPGRFLWRDVKDDVLLHTSSKCLSYLVGTDSHGGWWHYDHLFPGAPRATRRRHTSSDILCAMP